MNKICQSHTCVSFRIDVSNFDASFDHESTTTHIVLSSLKSHSQLLGQSCKIRRAIRLRLPNIVHVRRRVVVKGF